MRVDASVNTGIEPSVQEDSCIFEGMTSISAVIESILSGASDRRILEVWFDHARLYKKQRELGFLKAKSKELNFPIHEVDSATLDHLTAGTTHGGFAMRTTMRTYSPADGTVLHEKGFFVMLDGIEDPYNFGYSVRSLYAAGVDGILLPERNWMTAAGTVARSSAGTSEKIDIRIVHSAEDTIAAFKSAGYQVLAAEIKNSESLYHTDLRLPLLFIIGGEKRGISGSILSLCDRNVRIDYGRTFRGSLSAAATAAVIGFEVMRYNDGLQS